MEKQLVELMASLTTNSVITFISAETQVGAAVLRDVTLGQEYPVGRFLEPGSTTKYGAAVDTYGVEILDDVGDVIAIDLTSESTRWSMRNIVSGEVISSESGKGQVKEEDEAFDAMIQLLKAIDPEFAAYVERVQGRLEGLSDEERAVVLLEELEDLFKEEESEFSPGDTVKCIRSENLGSIFYQVGELYVVGKVNAEGEFTLKDTISDQENQFLAPVGNVWAFEKV